MFVFLAGDGDQVQLKKKVFRTLQEPAQRFLRKPTLLTVELDYLMHVFQAEFRSKTKKRKVQKSFKVDLDWLPGL